MNNGNQVNMEGRVDHNGGLMIYSVSNRWFGIAVMLTNMEDGSLIYLV